MRVVRRPALIDSSSDAVSAGPLPKGSIGAATRRLAAEFSNSRRPDSSQVVGRMQGTQRADPLLLQPASPKPRNVQTTCKAHAESTNFVVDGGAKTAHGRLARRS